MLFAIVFAETGLVVTPFLPGDSLLFAAGALAATGALDIRLVVRPARRRGDPRRRGQLRIGRYIGPRVFRAEDSAGMLHRLLNREHLDRAHEFFEQPRRQGDRARRGSCRSCGRSCRSSRAPARCATPSFAFYNVAGGVLWVAICVGAGYAFGNVPIVKENFSLVALGIVAVSLMPMVVEWLKHRKKGQRS